MSSKRPSLRRIAGFLWRHSFGSNKSSGNDHQMDADEPELQRNREEESELSEIANLSISQPTGDSIVNEKDLSYTLELVQSLYSEDVTIQLKAMQKMRKLFMDTPSLPIEQVIKPEAVPRFVRFIEDSRYTELQYESAWVLTKMAFDNSGQTQVVIDAGVVPVLIKLISSSDANVVEQSIWALGNIAADSTESRDLVLSSNVLQPLIGFLNDGNLSLSIMRKATWTLFNLCDKNLLPTFEQVTHCLPLLARLMFNRDDDILVSISWALAFLGEGSNEQIQIIIQSGVCSRAVQLLSHSSTEIVKAALCLVRKITAGNDSQARVPINENVLPALFNLLFHEKECIGENACKTLSKITAGTEQQIQAVIESGAVPVLIKLLTTSSNENVLQKSVITLGNIAADSTEFRNLVLHSNVLQPLLELFNNDNLSLPMMREVTWTLSRLCKNSTPNFAQVVQCLPLLARLMVDEDKPHHDDEEMLINVCQALYRLSDGHNDQIQVVIESGICQRAIQLLSHTSSDVVYAAIRLVGNIAAGTDSQTQVIVNENALPALASLLSHEGESIVENACWTLSSITARTEEQIQAVIDANIIPSLIELLQHEAISVRKQAAFAIANVTSNGSEKQIVYIVEARAIPSLCKLLSEADSKLTDKAISGLENILRTGESIAKTADLTVKVTVNPYAVLICNSPEMKLALYDEDTAIQLEATKRFGKLLRKSERFYYIIDEIIKSGTVPRFVHFLENSRNPDLQFESASVLHSITGCNSAQTQVVIDAGAVPVLIRLLSSSDEKVVEQSVWALGNIACDSTECRDLLLNSNVLPPLLGLFNNDNLSVPVLREFTWALACLCDKSPQPNFEQVSPCLPLLTRLMVNEDEEILGNVCQALSLLCDGPEQIQVVIDSGVCPLAVQLLSHNSNDVVLEALCLVCNITTGTDLQNQLLIKTNALPALCNLLSHEKASILARACWTLGNLIVGSNEQIQVVIDSGVCPRVVQLLGHTSADVVNSAIRLMCTVTAGGISQAQVLINENALPAIGSLLSHEVESIVESACRTLANLTLGSERHIQSIIDANIVPSLIVLLHYRAVIIRKHVAKTIANATTNGSVTQVVFIVEAGAIPPLCQLLSETDPDLIEDALSGLENILRAGKEISNSADSTKNRFATFTKQCGGFDKITLLASHDNVKIAQKAANLVEMYFA